MGDEILPSSIGITICQDKVLYEPMILMECYTDFERCSVCEPSVLAAKADVQKLPFQRDGKPWQVTISIQFGSDLGVDL